jgi:surface antigen
MDAWDYSLNFSSEMLVAGFVLIIAALNIIGFNPFKHDYTHQDKSLAAYVLKSNSGLNNQLAAKQNTISTTVVNKNGLISKAFADNEPAVLGASDTLNIETTEDGIEDNGITKANPDSVQKLVSRQVQIYETKPFDTVYTVAKQFKVSTQTIRDTNSLPDHSLKAGWFLVIPPVDGMVIQVNDANLTLPDVADKYRANMPELVSYNGLADESDMVEVGEFLIIPHGKLPEAPKPTPAPQQAKPAAPRAVTPSIPKSIRITGGHRFVAGQCTDYVSKKVFVPWGGNANRWIANSKAYGAYTDRKPVAGAILVTNENSRYGHVAYIESVNGSKVTFSEWNYAGPFKKTVRTLDISDRRIVGVIHPAQ